MERAFIETKVLADDSGLISGLAWKFGAPDRIGDWIEPGAFKGLKLPLPMLFGHDLNDPVGAWDRIEEKADGLHVSGRLLVDEVARAREVRALVKAGAVRGLSIGFVTKKATARTGGGRTIKALELFEVSLVSAPMHPGAKVTSAKSAAGALALADIIRRADAAIRGS
ncbi:HK97 family phage prohead protease [Ancylobacter rudongensis]|uniref:Phage prohead protease, HK97 family n=1 Tax=Ancylobacter rudongensis TaxID=177413 RepID=A0A1G4PPS8_9HYPH|nr:HK97 family phage prohead protease [Ancylobacter rudongensis]SCW34049.1 phage prohead protease, HK97 family [Ancylobacter rudongensis]